MTTIANDWMNFMVFSTTLCGNYEKWKDNPNISEIINVDTNPMCVNLKNNFPDAENKVIQSITLGFLCNVYYTVSQYNTPTTPSTFEDCEELNIDGCLEVD